MKNFIIRIQNTNTKKIYGIPVKAKNKYEAMEKADEVIRTEHPEMLPAVFLT